MLSSKIKYDEHIWIVCGDFNALSRLLGQQGGISNTHAFCLLDSRTKNELWIREQWTKRNEFTIGKKNIFKESLVPPDKVVLQSLHSKLGLMKQYAKSLGKCGEYFKYIYFPDAFVFKPVLNRCLCDRLW